MAFLCVPEVELGEEVEANVLVPQSCDFVSLIQPPLF